MIPFRERNKTVIGAVGILSILAVLAGSFSVDAIVGGDEYKAEFNEAAGLRPNDGDGEIKPGEVIPMQRTSAPFDVADAFQDLSVSVGELDEKQIAESFTVLADTFRDTPDEVQASLEGLGRLSRTLSARDQQLRALLDRSRGVTQVLAERDQDLTAFLADSSLVLQELAARREAISRLLDTTVQLSEQLRGLVRENRADLQPALERLRGVTDVLRTNQKNIDAALPRLAAFVRLQTNTIGNGRWFDTFIENLLAPTGFCPGTFGKDGTQCTGGAAPSGGTK
jgi:phospholipid/cholesterol/gamma-HCH transport system substrate-binding protein